VKTDENLHKKTETEYITLFVLLKFEKMPVSVQNFCGKYRAYVV